jgi:hypothetical protein
MCIPRGYGRVTSSRGVREGGEGKNDWIGIVGENHLHDTQANGSRWRWLRRQRTRAPVSPRLNRNHSWMTDLLSVADKRECSQLPADAPSLAGQDRADTPFPPIVDHHVQDQLHGPTFDSGAVAVELAALDAVDVPGHVSGLPIKPEPHPVGRIVFDLACAVVAFAAVHSIIGATIIVMIVHPDLRGGAAEYLDDVDLSAIVEAGIRGHHPERGEEPAGAVKLHG